MCCKASKKCGCIPSIGAQNDVSIVLFISMRMRHKFGVVEQEAKMTREIFEFLLSTRKNASPLIIDHVRRIHSALTGPRAERLLRKCGSGKNLESIRS